MFDALTLQNTSSALTIGNVAISAGSNTTALQIPTKSGDTSDTFCLVNYGNCIDNSSISGLVDCQY